MAWFTAKEWKNRLVEFAGRRSLKNVSTNETTVYDVTRNEGQVSQEGDAFSATNMNEFEQRVQEGFDTAEESFTQLSSDFASGQMEIRLTESGKGEYRKKGADTWIPFSGKEVFCASTSSNSSRATLIKADGSVKNDIGVTTYQGETMAASVGLRSGQYYYTDITAVSDGDYVYIDSSGTEHQVTVSAQETIVSNYHGMYICAYKV